MQNDQILQSCWWATPTVSRHVISQHVNCCYNNWLDSLCGSEMWSYGTQQWTQNSCTLLELGREVDVMYWPQELRLVLSDPEAQVGLELALNMKRASCLYSYRHIEVNVYVCVQHMEAFRSGLTLYIHCQLLVIFSRPLTVALILQIVAFWVCLSVLCSLYGMYCG